MKKSILLFIAVAMCVIFTACPPIEHFEPVVIPDGIYEETVNFWGYTAGSPMFLYKDTTMTTIVEIVDGYFIYPDMCRDTFHINYEDMEYCNHFIYLESEYCHKCQVTRSPVQIIEWGGVLVKRPMFCFSSEDDVVLMDSTYVMDFPVYKYEDAYIFDQEHRLYHTFITHHTLRPRYECKVF